MIKRDEPFYDMLSAAVPRMNKPGPRLTWSMPGAPVPTEASDIHPHLNLTTDMVVADLERLATGSGSRLETEVAREATRAAGLDPDNLPSIGLKARRRVHNEIVDLLRRRMRERAIERDTLSTMQCLLVGEDGDPVVWQWGNSPSVRCTVHELKQAIGIPVEDFLAMDKEERHRAMRRATHRLRAVVRSGNLDQTEATVGRTLVHESLVSWNAGELRLERPQSSSLHHLVEYDLELQGQFGRQLDDCQCVVVENDWGASVPPIAGEWMVPFPLMCWEFRISGVRVLAFTDADDLYGGMTRPAMWMVYGREGHWVIDDYVYETGCPELPRGIPHRRRNGLALGDDERDSVELRRAARMTYDCIRAICIMREAEVIKHQPVSASAAQVGARRREGRAPPRDYVTVRLVGGERRAHVRRAASSGHAAESRAPQRGHWRSGTWVHYDDQDSGQVQYVNDGGFVVSKTWRKWHFAGDPRNILHKEYRA